MPARRGRGIELLVDPVRRRIIAMLIARAMRSSEIALEIGRSRATATYHLRLMSRAGLLRRTWSRVDYRGRVYYVNPRMLPTIAVWLAGVDLPASKRPHHMTDDLEPWRIDNPTE
jgi:DNA-binding transcriptional ArsR family regulator